MTKSKKPVNQNDNQPAPSSPELDAKTRSALSAALSAIEELLACAGKNVTYDAEAEADVAERKIKELLGK